MFIMEFHQMFARLHYELYIIIIILGYKKLHLSEKKAPFYSYMHIQLRLHVSILTKPTNQFLSVT